MQNVLETLENEHKTILSMLDILEKIANRLEHGEVVPEPHIFGILDFFRIYVEKDHHAKEKQILFPFLNGKQSSNKISNSHSFFDSHGKEEIYIRNMLSAIESDQDYSIQAQQFILNARRYKNLLQHQITKENHELFPLIEESLDQEEKIEIDRKLHMYQQEQIDDPIYRELATIMNELRLHYN